MAATIPQIIATINPDLYYSVSDDKEKAKKEIADFKKLIKEKGFQAAAEKAKPKIPATHKIVYDSATETLEPIYFWTLDLITEFGLNPEKLVDNFSSSPGSGHFAELGQRATIMQQQGSKMLEMVNTLLRSVLNIIYDLKEFKIRLSSYDHLKDPKTKEAAILSLKQIWLDKVDINKGNSSLKAMSFGQAGFQTLLDAFLIVEDVSLKVPGTNREIDLNERVKRILRPRIQEFNIWLGDSEKELRKRYNLERTYLKSQVNSLKMYSRWARPYLMAANQLEGVDSGRNPALVKVFNTIVLELSLMGKREIKLPGELKVKNKRKYYNCVFVDFIFRGIPQRVAQQSHFAFGGRAEIVFSGYALNEEEIKKLNEELDNSDIKNVLKFAEGATQESLDQLQEEIQEFLDEKDEKEEKAGESKKPKDTSNPFAALFGRYNSKEDAPKKEENKKSDGIAKDSGIEKEYLRKPALDDATNTAFTLFDIYKKAHGMNSYM